MHSIAAVEAQEYRKPSQLVRRFFVLIFSLSACAFLAYSNFGKEPGFKVNTFGLDAPAAQD